MFITNHNNWASLNNNQKQIYHQNQHRKFLTHIKIHNRKQDTLIQTITHKKIANKAFANIL